MNNKPQQPRSVRWRGTASSSRTKSLRARSETTRIGRSGFPFLPSGSVWIIKERRRKETDGGRGQIKREKPNKDKTPSAGELTSINEIFVNNEKKRKGEELDDDDDVRRTQGPGNCSLASSILCGFASFFFFFFFPSSFHFQSEQCECVSFDAGETDLTDIWDPKSMAMVNKTQSPSSPHRRRRQQEKRTLAFGTRDAFLGTRAWRRKTVLFSCEGEKCQGNNDNRSKIFFSTNIRVHLSLSLSPARLVKEKIVFLGI